MQFIAIDTEGWSEEQLAWIRKTLADSAGNPDIRWRVVYGHHPILTSGVHLNERKISVLREQLLPVLRAARVDFYICGHDHDLEHLEAEGMDFLICGGGGAALQPFRRRGNNSLFAAVDFAFLDLSINEHQFTARFFDANLNSLEQPGLARMK